VKGLVEVVNAKGKNKAFRACVRRAPNGPV
jgi:hypothetical protein